MAANTGYTAHDTARFVAETHSSARGDFARDRARLLHSFSWRRLASKTQVLSPLAGVEFARNRMTHSLEVAQIGRELAASFRVSPDLVDTACLAHDLGHPPFGHNGEVALNAWLADAGGFEGNAQTLRILTRLEAKTFTQTYDSAGLNLTRATLDATCKYPWQRPQDAGTKVVKFGCYPDDLPIFTWLREGAIPDRKCFEAQLMDLADDIAYSVHDFEDAIVSGYLDPLILRSSDRDLLLAKIAAWSQHRYGLAQLEAAYERIMALALMPHDWNGSRKDLAQLKNLTSDLIGRFVTGALAATRTAQPEVTNFARYNANVVVPADIACEIAVLKGIVAVSVMQAAGRQNMYEKQRQLLAELLDKLWADPKLLDLEFFADFERACGQAAKKRVIADQVASLTDQRAIKLHQELCQVSIV